MVTRCTVLVVAAAAVPVVMLSTPAHGQSVLDGSTAFENLGLALGRPPGNMVGAGIARAQEAADRGFAQVIAPQITETQRPPTLRGQIMLEVVDTLVTELNRMILVLANRFLARAGLMPLIPPELLTAPTTGDGAAGLGDLLDQIGGAAGEIGSGSTDSGSTDSEAVDSATGVTGSEGTSTNTTDSDSNATGSDTSDSRDTGRPGRGSRG